MNKFARQIAIALALVFAVAGGAETAEAKYRSRAKVKDGRSARAAVIKNYKAKNRSTKVRVHKTGMSRSGKSMQVLVASRNGKVRAMNIRKGSAYETRTQNKTQASALKAAHQKLRRQNGTYSGVNKSGLSKSGKSYKFNSATDRRAKTGDRAYVNTKTGKVSTYVRGR
jgi:hypothetical protein